MIAQVVKGNARGSGYARNARDWYCEPAWSVNALLDVESFVGFTHDPACGSGNIPECFKVRSLDAGGSDIVDRGYREKKDLLRGYGDGQNDFLSPFWLHLDKPIANIVTNPPFNLATEFLLKSLQIATDKVCILQRLAWLEGKARREMFENTPLARVWVFSRRVSMPPGGSEQPAKGGSVAFGWYVWEQGYRGPPTLGWYELAAEAAMGHLARQFGFDLDETARGHARFTNKATGQVIFGSGTPSDRRAWKNIRAQLKRVSRAVKGAPS